VASVAPSHVSLLVCLMKIYRSWGFLALPWATTVALLQCPMVARLQCPCAAVLQELQQCGIDGFTAAVVMDCAPCLFTPSKTRRKSGSHGDTSASGSDDEDQQQQQQQQAEEKGECHTDGAKGSKQGQPCWDLRPLADLIMFRFYDQHMHKLGECAAAAARHGRRVVSTPPLLRRLASSWHTALHLYSRQASKYWASPHSLT